MSCNQHRILENPAFMLVSQHRLDCPRVQIFFSVTHFEVSSWPKLDFSTIWRSLFSRFQCLLLGLLLPSHRNIPIIHSCCSNLHCLKYCQCPMSNTSICRNGLWELTVICSRKKSRSSSQLLKFCLAVANLVVSNSSASSIGYESMTFA